VYVTGFTCSNNPSNFPVKNAFQPESHSQDCANGGGDAFVTRVNAAGSDLDYSTYLGGMFGNGGQGIAVDSIFHAYVTGSTDSPDFPTTPGAFQRTLRADPDGGRNAFVTKFSADGRSLVYSTFLGGTASDRANAIAVDGSERAYVTGVATSADFPVTSAAFQRTLHGPSDAFVTKLQKDGAGLIYSTYLGGSGDETGRSIAVNSLGHAHVTGSTSSSNFPVKNAIDSTYNGGLDVFVTKLFATGSGRHYSTFLGGSGDDEGLAIRLDANNNAYLTGSTASTNFRTTSGAYRRSLRGAQDAFVAKIAP
jgi:hypothetical protein